MFEPRNELGVIVLFAQTCHKFGMEILEISDRYPDALIRWKGRELRAEFEYRSSSFYSHGHDSRCCDLIICWNDDYVGAIPVIAIKYPGWLIDEDFQFATKSEKESEFWQEEAKRLKRELSSARAQLAELNADDGAPSDWRLVDDETRRDIADMSTKEVVAKYGVSDSTARRWRRWSIELQE